MESYGVIYLSIINLPRNEHFKQENVLLVGVIPAFEHEPDTLNPFFTATCQWTNGVLESWSETVRCRVVEIQVAISYGTDVISL